MKHVRGKRREIVVVRDDGDVICERCMVADTPVRRMRGLLGRPELAPGEGLVLRPAPGIHTFFMRFPIDAVFLDENGFVIDVRHELTPWRTATCRTGHAVLELPVGEARRRNIQPGDRLTGVSKRRRRLREIHSIREPARVLVASRDKRFVRVSAFLLGRAGFTVITSTRPDATVTRATEELPHVVVLDGASAEEVNGVVEGLASLQPPIGVVVLADAESLGRPTGLSVIERWGAFDDLVDQIELARRAPVQASRALRAASND